MCNCFSNQDFDPQSLHHVDKPKQTDWVDVDRKRTAVLEGLKDFDKATLSPTETKTVDWTSEQKKRSSVLDEVTRFDKNHLTPVVGETNGSAANHE